MKHFHVLTGYIIIMSILYILACIIPLSFDIRDWHILQRIIFVIAAIVILVAAVVTEEDDKKK